MTPEEEKALLETVSVLKKGHEVHTVKVAELETTIKAKDTEIAALKQGHATLSQQTEKSGLKAAYPDVPEGHLDMALGMPADKREAFLKPTQELATKAKAAQAKANSSDPMAGWMNAGSIGPTDDAARAAEAAEAAKKHSEAKGRGDVHGMLGARASDVTAFLRESLAKAGVLGR